MKNNSRALSLDLGMWRNVQCASKQVKMSFNRDGNWEPVLIGSIHHHLHLILSISLPLPYFLVPWITLLLEAVRANKNCEVKEVNMAEYHKKEVSSQKCSFICHNGTFSGFYCAWCFCCRTQHHCLLINHFSSMIYTQKEEVFWNMCHRSHYIVVHV